eukprot:gnl/MRDRNA2_/MRDRNA2_79193_c0_seq3.p1 gnl/MRDRNA2_/MRDRNA2_79193_c0~~gnl/MRDRNA2_/MRDRNA2_79193_c0_seq3.p1  ORF type:complete len:532 (+),score=105.59 gnl/MRDRNA2_/MRDRNA2_79193_c0_seq3:227-1597(+)
MAESMLDKILPHRDKHSKLDDEDDGSEQQIVPFEAPAKRERRSKWDDKGDGSEHSIVPFEVPKAKDAIVALPRVPNENRLDHLQGWQRQRHIGKVKWFDPDKNQGRLECDAILRFIGTDIELHGHNLVGVRPIYGDTCEFGVMKNKDRGWMAVDIKWINCQGTGKRDMALEELQSQFQMGKIATYHAAKGFGFIHSKALYSFFQKEIFFLKTELRGALTTMRGTELEGQEVQFTFEMKPKGPQATVVDAAGTTAEALQERENRIQTAMGQVHQGNIHKMDPAGSYGFIYCKELTHTLGKNGVFFAKTHVIGQKQNIVVGTEVRFTFEMTLKEGKHMPIANAVEQVIPGALSKLEVKAGSMVNIAGVQKAGMVVPPRGTVVPPRGAVVPPKPGAGLSNALGAAMPKVAGMVQQPKPAGSYKPPALPAGVSKVAAEADPEEPAKKKSKWDDGDFTLAL